MGLPLFDGIDPESGCNIEVGAFQKAFSRLKCLAAYAKVGAPTREGVTRACLNNPQVLTSNDTSNDIAKLCWSIQNANELAIHALTQAGYNGQLLKATLKKKLEEEDQQITLLNTQARREVLAHARGHGGWFHATGGMHVTSDDLFISMEMATRKEETLALEKEKKLCLSLQAIEEKALAIVEQGKPVNLLLGADLGVLLAWQHASKTKGAKKADKGLQWMTILADGGQPPAYERWTDDDEQRLVSMQTTSIDLSNTQYGRELALKKQELEAATDKFNWEERDAMRQKLDAMDTEDAITSLEGELGALGAEVTASTDRQIGAI